MSSSSFANFSSLLVLSVVTVLTTLIAKDVILTTYNVLGREIHYAAGAQVSAVRPRSLAISGRGHKTSFELGTQSLSYSPKLSTDLTMIAYPNRR